MISRSNVENISLAPSLTLVKRKIICSDVEDRSNLGCIKNSEFKVKCKDCDFAVNVFAGRYNIQRTIELQIKNESSDMYKHCTEMRHSMDRDIMRKD